jgi:hypothetical protein
MLGAAFLTGSQAENVTAQTDTATCTDVIRGALREVGANCNSLSRNSVCYGFNQVNSTFTQVVPANFFSRPADRGELTVFERIQTASLRLQENIWGIAVLSVQANLPQTLPGQNVLFMLVGDTQVENAVPPGRAFMGGMTSAVVTRDLGSGDLDSPPELEGFDLLYPITLPQLVPPAPPLDPPVDLPT